MLLLNVSHVSSPVVAPPAALKLIKDAVVLVERAQLTPEITMNLMRERSKSQNTLMSRILI